MSGLRVVCAWSVLCMAGTAQAGEPGGQQLGLAFDVGLASAYVWRGWNLFQDESQKDPNLLLAPGVTWSLGDSGFSVGYWSAWQLTGPNRGALIDAGTGAEQDVILSYSRSLTDRVSAAFGLTGYLYPLADEEIAGTAVPAFLEPAVGLSWEGPVTASLNVAWFHGIQEALAGYRNVYLRPGLAWSHGLGARANLEVSGGFGTKLFTDVEAPVETNTMDVLLGAAVPVDLGGGVYLKPSLNVAWTEIKGAGFMEGLAPWAGLNLGCEL
jgi:hypothetical protein